MVAADVENGSGSDIKLLMKGMKGSGGRWQVVSGVCTVCVIRRLEKPAGRTKDQKISSAPLSIPPVLFSAIAEAILYPYTAECVTESSFMKVCCPLSGVLD